MSDIRIPVPDPLGIFEDITKNAPVKLFDPVLGGKKEPVVPPAPLAQPEPELDEIGRYKHHLSEAYRYAPCPGCKKLVTGALVGVEIFEKMEETGVGAKDISQDDIEKIKQSVKDKYGE